MQENLYELWTPRGSCFACTYSHDCISQTLSEWHYARCLSTRETEYVGDGPIESNRKDHPSEALHIFLNLRQRVQQTTRGNRTTNKLQLLTGNFLELRSEKSCERKNFQRDLCRTRLSRGQLHLVSTTGHTDGSTRSVTQGQHHLYLNPSCLEY